MIKKIEEPIETYFTSTIVTAKVDGDFDKTGLPDPLLLDFHFTVANTNKKRVYDRF